MYWPGNITHYQIYTTADGLSHRVVRDILQDRKGYLWMATWNGLCQYDGCEFSTYNKLDDGQLIGRLGFDSRNGEWRVFAGHHKINVICLIR